MESPSKPCPKCGKPHPAFNAVLVVPLGAPEPLELSGSESLEGYERLVSAGRLLVRLYPALVGPRLREAVERRLAEDRELAAGRN